VLWRLIKEHIKPYKGLLTGVCVLQLIAAIASLTLPNIQADIINFGVSLGDTHYIWTHGGLMLGVSFIQIAAQIGAAYCGVQTAMAVGRDIRAHLFDHVLSFSLREVNEFGAPSLITRNTNDVNQVQMLIMMTCVMIISAPITMIGGVFMALRQDVGLSWIILVAVVIMGIIVAIVMNGMVPLFRMMQTRIDNMNRVLREQISGIRVIRAFVREPWERDRFAGANADLRTVGIKVGTWFAILMPIIMAIMNGSVIAIYWFGGHRVQDGTIQPGNMTAFMTYLMQILMSVMMAAMMMMVLPRAQVCGGRIMEVLNTPPSVVPPANPVAPAEGVYCQIEFRDVDFAYPGAEKPVLKDISFKIDPGTTTAVIGATGSGKTTLVNLIPRLYDATKGQVLIDGVDIKDMDPDLLWSKVGLVPQKPYLFTGTVASNLQYGRPDATVDGMWKALQIAQADGFVAKMDGQLEAEIAQGGTNVSGGQRQRLAIARALIKMPEVYVFDDAFSALDVATDAKLRAALATETGTAAILIVAQRVSSISHANQILVLDEGRIVGRGTHDELMRECPTYHEIVDSQVRAEDAGLMASEFVSTSSVPTSSTDDEAEEAQA